jgi:hypothetical protein
MGFRPLRVVGALLSYLLMGSHQMLTAPLALLRYARDVLTGPGEWLKTEHRGAPRPEAI